MSAIYAMKLNKDELIVCKSHEQQCCTQCRVNWTEQNELAASLKNVKELPAPNKMIVSTTKAEINRIKLEGNQAYKVDKCKDAVKLYTAAAELVWSRPLWEPLAFQSVREELSPILSNRSAANCNLGNYIEALVDAHIVTQLKKDWSKGWFRKGKALMGLNRFDEAGDAFRTGLRYTDDSTNKDLLDSLKQANAAKNA